MKVNKTIYLFLLGLITSFPVFSQALVDPISVPLEKGSHFVGLNGTGSYSGSPSTKSTGFQIAAQGGIFVVKRLVTGVQLSYDKFYGEIEDPSVVVSSPVEIDAERTVKNFSPELFARYYFFQTRFRPLLQVSAGGSFQNIGRTSFAGLNTESSIAEFTAAAQLGLGWFVAKRVSVELLYELRTRPASYAGGSQLRLGASVFLK